MKLVKVSKKLIKPQTPTPPDLKHYPLSFLDKLMVPAQFSLILFHESKPENNTNLLGSLSKILVQFYPLAGRYTMNDHFVDCSDQGVVFVEAEALDINLIDLVAKPQAEHLTLLLPNQCFLADPPNPILSIQTTNLPTGGMAIAFVVSHYVMDASSLATFISAWSEAVSSDGKTGLTPSFHLSSLLPHKDHNFQFNMQPEDKRVIVKKFCFHKAAISSLRWKLRQVGSEAPLETRRVSRVRIVCAVIAKTLIGLDRAKHGKARDFVISLAVNLRERTIPTQPKHACGNFSVPSLTPRVTLSEDKGIEIGELVDIIGDSITETIDDYVELLSPYRDGCDIIINSYRNLMREIGDRDTNTMVFSDWSKFGFYEADFGWGKPVWTSIGPLRPLINTTMLMNTKDGEGIEAWVHLDQDDMRHFEEDEGIRVLTSQKN